jgi:hypothetical protein
MMAAPSSSAASMVTGLMLPVDGGNLAMNAGASIGWQSRQPVSAQIGGRYRADAGIGAGTRTVRIPVTFMPSPSQPRAICSPEPDCSGSGRRLIRNEMSSPARPARMGMRSAT